MHEGAQWRIWGRRRTLALVSLAALISCTANTLGGYLSVAAMRTEPAADLVPPGATVISTLSAEPFNNVTGPQPGHYGHLFGTDMTAADVAEFYAGELPKLGWRAGRPPIRGSGERDIWGWCKQNMLFRLATLDPRDDRVWIDVEGRSRLVFDARITDADC